jgi:hypothetical protein
MLGEIGGTRSDNATDRPNTGGGHARIGEFADADGEIDMLLDQLGYPVRERQVAIHVGIGREKTGDDRQHVRATKDDRRGDDQIAGRSAVLAGGGALRLADLTRMRRQAER